MRQKESHAGHSYALLNSILESAFDGIILINEFGEILRINKAVESLFGYKTEELIGRNINFLMPEPYHSKHDSYLKNYLRTGEKKVIGIGREVTGLRKDGKHVPFYLSINEFQLDGDTYFTGIVHNLSNQKEAERILKDYAETLERKVEERTIDIKRAYAKIEMEIEQKIKAEEELIKSQNLYKLISRNFPNGTINVFDEELNYVFVEGKELVELNISTDDLLGSNYIKRLDASVRDAVKEKLMAVFKGNPDYFEILVHDNTYLLRAEPLYDFHGKVNQILVVETNITARKQSEKDMKEALMKERELNEMKSRFVSMASHEFRTPLSAIKSSASLIGRYISQDLQEKRLKHIERIKSNVNSLNLILEDFLSLEKLSEGIIQPNFQSVDLRTFVNEVKEEMEEVIFKGQYIELVGTEEKITLNTDRNILKNVFNNLISNASKYSGNSTKIEIGFESNEMAHLWVKDFGIGIPKRDQSKIFSRFFRASNAFNIEGTGLGLNIVRRYVELLGGSIEFESEMGHGTCFHLYLPLKK